MERDWAASALGPLAAWPQSLRTALGLVLKSPVPMVMLWGEDGIMLYNDAYSGFAGARHPELLGTKVREGWPEVAAFNDNVMRVGLAGDTLSYRDQELTLFRNGAPEQVFMNLDYSPIPGEDGRPAGVLAVVIETTGKVLSDRARAAAEAALVRERDRAQGVLENMAEGFVLLDRDFRIVDINPEGLRLEGRPRSDFIGKTHWEAWPGTEESALGTLYRQAMAERIPIVTEHRYTWSDGRSAWVDMRAYPSGEGLALFFRDVSARRRTAELAREAAERVQLALDAGAIIGTFMWDIAADRIFADERFAATFGMDPEQCRAGMPLSEAFDSIHPDDRERVAEAIAEALQRGGGYRCQYRVRQHDDVYRWIEANGRVDIAADGTPLRFPGVLLDVDERRMLEAERDRATTILRTFAEAVPGVVYAKDLEGRLLVANRGTTALLGKPPEAYIGRTDAEVLDDKAQAATVMANDRRVMDGGEAEQIEEEVRLPDGTSAVWLSTKAPLRNEQGEIVGLVGSSVDITERRMVEDALRASEERLRIAQATGGIGTFELIPATGRIIVSEQFCRLWGTPVIDETDVGYFLAIIHPDDRERVMTGRSALPEKALDYIEYRIVRPDTGEVRWLAREGEPVRSADGQIRYFGVSYDITARKLAEMRLRAESETLETLNETGAALAGELELERIVQMVTDAGVSLIGAAFGAFFYNLVDDAGESYMLYTLSGAERSAFENFGMPRATAVFKPTFDGDGIIRSDDILADPRYGHNDPHRGMPEGHLPVRSYLAVPVQSRSGDVIGGLFFGHPETGRFEERHERLMAGIAAQAAIALDNARLYQSAQRQLQEKSEAEAALRELNETLEQRIAAAIAERESAEEALRQAQKMEAVGQLTGGIAHDFNNLLTVVTGNIDMAGRALDAAEISDARARRALDNAMKGAERAASLTQRLLAFSRRQPLAPKATDVDKLVVGMSDLLNRALGETVKLEVVTAPGLWRVEVDPNQLESAILNLAVNARDAMPQGGELIVETSNARLDDAYTAQHAEVAPGQYVVIAVTDTGEGMPKHVQEKVFEPFYTTKEVGKGTGLGLSMVYGFVKQSGGHVKIYSEEGHGTTIKIYLPRLVGETADLPEPLLTQGLETSPKAELLLVVEDDDDVRAYTVECLRELGYKVLEAHDGASALRLLERQDEPVDLLFTDVVMPGMSGRELADAARTRQPDLRVLYTSGYTRNAIALGGRLEPGVEMIAKPFTYQALAQKVRDVLDRGRTGRVLLVEAEPTVRALAMEALSAAGYTAEEAANAGEALGKVRSAQGRYDAVFVDHDQPDGPGLVTELRALHVDLPILLATAGDQTGLAKRHAEDRCTSLIAKPYTGARLSEALRQAGVNCGRAAADESEA
nr:PAS domain-containing protein [Sphingosinicella sp. BN140058]